MKPTALLTSLLLACGPDTVTTDGGAAGSTSDDGTTAASPTASTSPSAGTSASTSSADETSQTSMAVVDDPDLGQGSECDIFAQDCPPGLKCMPYADDGGNSWNAAGCFPVVEDPAAPGEPCMVEGSGVSGIDTCALGSMCFYVDPDTLEGTCVAFCVGTPDEPYCEDAGSQCTITAEGVLVLCIPRCHPLEDDCPEGEGCYPVGAGFQCVPDDSGELGSAGDPCEVVNACDPTTFCAASVAVPDCANALGCCSSFCTLGDDSPCLPGQTCQPWYDRGNAPPGYEDLGGCVLP